MASDIEICNRALQHLGQARINSLDEPVRSARECKFSYPVARDALLQLHSWNFATKRTVLAASGSVSGAGRFPLPADLIRIEGVEGARTWSRQGKVIIADSADALTLTYIRRIEDPNDMSPLFRETLSLRLALDLLQTFAPGVTQAQLLDQKYRRSLTDARWADGKNQGTLTYEVEDFFEARHGNTGGGSSW